MGLLLFVLCSMKICLVFDVCWFSWFVCVSVLFSVSELLCCGGMVSGLFILFIM